jgi:hypothetical protein
VHSNRTHKTMANNYGGDIFGILKDLHVFVAVTSKDKHTATAIFTLTFRLCLVLLLLSRSFSFSTAALKKLLFCSTNFKFENRLYPTFTTFLNL